MPDLNFLKLPWEIQVALASGYAAYALAYMGLRDRQRTIDIAFLSLVFSVPATIVFSLLASRSPYLSAPLAFVAAFVVALIWRKGIRPFVFPVLRRFNVTWSDDDPSALATLIGNSKFGVTQIAVQLDDGTWLRCDDLSKFQHAPFWPYVLGPSGDVAFYLTHEDSVGGVSKILTTTRDPYYGDAISYVPAGRIKQINIRHIPKISCSLMAAEAAEPASKAASAPSAVK
jgi:hypothetical protein